MPFPSTIQPTAGTPPLPAPIVTQSILQQSALAGQQQSFVPAINNNSLNRNVSGGAPTLTTNNSVILDSLTSSYVSINPTSTGLSVYLPNVVQALITTQAEIVLKNSGMYHLRIRDAAGTHIGWLMAGHTTTFILESSLVFPSLWRQVSGDTARDRGIYLGNVVVGISSPSTASIPSTSVMLNDTFGLYTVAYTASFNIYGFSFVDGYAAVGNFFNYSTTNGYNTYCLDITPITSTTAFMLYSTTASNTIYGVVLTLNTSTLAVTAGTPVAMPTAGLASFINPVCCDALSATSVLCAYTTVTTGQVKAVICTISGTTVTTNTEMVITGAVNTSGANPIIIAALTSNLACLHLNGTVYRLSVSGTTITAATGLVLANGGKFAGLVANSPTQTLVSYSSATPVNYLTLLTDNGSTFSANQVITGYGAQATSYATSSYLGGYANSAPSIVTNSQGTTTIRSDRLHNGSIVPSSYVPVNYSLSVYYSVNAGLAGSTPKSWGGNIPFVVNITGYAYATTGILPVLSA